MIGAGWWRQLSMLQLGDPRAACLAFAAWLRKLRRAVADLASKQSVEADEPKFGGALRELLGHCSEGARVIVDVARSEPALFIDGVLSEVVELVRLTALPGEEDLDPDLIFAGRAVRDDPGTISDAILEGLSTSFASAARREPRALDRWLDPLGASSSDTIAFILLDAWAHVPEEYATKIIDFLARDARRLDVGYAISGSGGHAGSFVSRTAIARASEHGTTEELSVLTQTILDFWPKYERENPRIRGMSQLRLLASIPPEKRSEVASQKLKELHRKFPDWSDSPPGPLRSYSVESPIPDDAIARMTDLQWIGALREYSGVHRKRGSERETAGGEFQLAGSLREATVADPVRFAALGAGLPTDVAPRFLSAILDGLLQSADHREPRLERVDTQALSEVIQRAHGFADRPCGVSICRLVGAHSNRSWPQAVLDAVTWYAQFDPHPSSETWRKPAPGGGDYQGGDPYSTGINSVRGVAAEAIADLLDAEPGRWPLLSAAAESLATDPSASVRSCAAALVMPLYVVSPRDAEEYFFRLLEFDEILLRTPIVRRCIRFFTRKDYVKTRPVLERMLKSSDAKLVEGAAVAVSLAILDGSAPEADLDRLRQGSIDMRRGAAKVFARNVTDPDVGAACLIMVVPFLADPEERVRSAASEAFQAMPKLATEQQAVLLEALLATTPTVEVLEKAVEDLEHSLERLPDLSCQLLEHVVSAIKSDASNIQTHSYLTADAVSKLVMRLYTQTEDDLIRTRCLNLIDEMSLTGFAGLAKELETHDR